MPIDAIFYFQILDITANEKNCRENPTELLLSRVGQLETSESLGDNSNKILVIICGF